LRFFALSVEQIRAIAQVTIGRDGRLGVRDRALVCATSAALGGPRELHHLPD
jgi:hypothetical protein